MNNESKVVKTNSGLLEYAKNQVGLPYWYKCCGQIATVGLYNKLKKQYPSYYTANDFASQYGKRVYDAIGLIKGYLWSDNGPTYKSSNYNEDINMVEMYSKADIKGIISNLPSTPGILVFRGTSTVNITHIGIYDGCNYVYEAKGHAYGVLKSTYDISDWDYWAQCPFTVDDTSAEVIKANRLGTTIAAVKKKADKISTITDSSSNKTSNTVIEFNTGDVIKLDGVNMYASSATKHVTKVIKGKYYVWSNKIMHDRIRITNKPEYVENPNNILGWIDADVVK